jgi:hypothetical protein
MVSGEYYAATKNALQDTNHQMKTPKQLDESSSFPRELLHPQKIQATVVRDWLSVAQPPNLQFKPGPQVIRFLKKFL